MRGDIETTDASKDLANSSVVLPGNYRNQIDENGFAIVENVLSQQQVENLRDAISNIPQGEEVRRRENVYGIRNLLELSAAVRQLAVSSSARAVVKPILGTECSAVRATFFDKVPGANWKLRLHQDCVISVRQKIEAEGFQAWSVKAGVVQVRPPEHVLTNMLAVRFHLDDCLQDNGALRVLAGSHRQRWAREDLPSCRLKFAEEVCEVNLGGVLAMRPLVLHASSPSQSPHHRRVIHIEYANCALPNGLEWNNELRA